MMMAIKMMMKIMMVQMMVVMVKMMMVIKMMMAKRTMSTRVISCPRRKTCCLSHPPGKHPTARGLANHAARSVAHITHAPCSCSLSTWKRGWTTLRKEV